MSDLMMGLIAIVLGQVVAFTVQALVLDQWRKTRRMNRLRGEYKVGQVFRELRDGSGGPPLLGRCMLFSMSRGRVEFHTMDTGPGTDYDTLSLVVTGQEAEALHPILEVE